METLIKKAIEGGYRNYDKSRDMYISTLRNEIFLDKEFWQALGEASVWIHQDKKWW